MDIILMVADSITLNDVVSPLQPNWVVRDLSAHYCIVEDKASNHLIFNREEDMLQHYEREEIENVSRAIGDFVFFSAEFSDLEFGKEILARCVDDEKIWVDDDHGGIRSGIDFARLCHDPDFDWTVSSE
jgi:hypothetical protein